MKTDKHIGSDYKKWFEENPENPNERPSIGFCSGCFDPPPGSVLRVLKTTIATHVRFEVQYLKRFLFIKWWVSCQLFFSERRAFEYIRDFKETFTPYSKKVIY